VFPVAVLAFSVTLPPVQNVVDPDAVIFASGPTAVVTTVALDVFEQPLFVTDTV